MGDRTSVTLTVPTELRAEAERIALANGFESAHTSEVHALGITHISFYEVNYGELPFLDELTDASIAHDSDWDHGSEYSKGCAFVRFTPEGEPRYGSYDDDTFHPNLNQCMSLLDDPNALIQYIKNHKEEVTPLPWDNQVEYGKLYRTKQLIST